MNDLELQCSCKKVKGKVHGMSLSSGNRLVCYCKSCQAFVRYLNSDALNDFGGSDIFQVPPAFITIDQGIEQIKSLRLTDKGVCRWYASCCNTPIGTTTRPNVPMVGILRSFIADNQNVEEKIGAPVGNVFIKHLDQALPSNLQGRLSEKRVVFRMISKLLVWKVMGHGKPNPFYNDVGKPIIKPHRV